VTILVVAAHPDDEVLGCGGTIARYAAEAHDVHIAILGEGITSRYGERDAAPAAEIEQLAGHARAAGAALGARSVSFGGLPDNRFDTVALLDIVKPVEQWVAAFRPDAIYTHHPGDLNVDHGLTFRAVLTATRPGASPVIVPDLYAFEVPSSTDWAFQRLGPPFRPRSSISAPVSTARSRRCSATRASGAPRRIRARRKCWEPPPPAGDRWRECGMPRPSS
jgi:LmbE family N-acetylglucosaminyl deacetylase